MYKGQFISVVIPALNEEKAIGKVVLQLWELTYTGKPVIDEIIVCDNGSSDATNSVASQAGAIVVTQPIPGYGIACLTAISELSDKCDIVLFVDGDHSCYPQQAIALIEGVSNGDNLAIGSRALGKIEHGALTPVQLFGNWLSAQLIKLLYKKTITDLGPFRAIRKTSLEQLNMQDKSFGWTVEMQVKAIKQNMQVNEYPVDSTLRIGESKISGTVKGSILAGIGILSMIAKLYFKK